MNPKLKAVFLGTAMAIGVLVVSTLAWQFGVRAALWSASAVLVAFIIYAAVNVLRPDRRPGAGQGGQALDHQERTRAAATAKVGRNDPCPCGSGLKYKQCCGAA